MTRDDLVIWGAALCAGIALGALAYVLLATGIERFRDWRRSVQRRFEQEFRRAAIEGMTPVGASRLYCASLLLMPAFSLLVLGSVASAAAGALLIYLTPRALLGYLQRGRLARIEEQLPAALDQIGRSVSAGLSLAQALEEVSESAPEPIRHEFALVSRDHMLGSSLTEAVQNAAERLQSRQFDLVSTALLVNIDKGGDLKKALATISNSMKEIWRLEQKMLTASSEGRKAMLVISVVPLFVLLLVAFLQPDLMSTLTGSLPGYAILLLAGLMYGGGFLWLRRILATEI
jgi:tight adherence protein B